MILDSDRLRLGKSPGVVVVEMLFRVVFRNQREMSTRAIINLLLQRREGGERETW